MSGEPRRLAGLYKLSSWWRTVDVDFLRCSLLDVPADPDRAGDKELLGEDGNEVLAVLLFLLAEELVVDVDVDDEEEAVETFECDLCGFLLGVGLSWVCR